NPDAAADVERAGATAEVVPHGVDLSRFRPGPRRAGRPLGLLAVGRLVEKKGFHVLVEAAARLGMPFRLRIVGEGPERARLEERVAHHGLGGSVELTGALPHDELPAVYASADVFVAPSVEDASGDRDGLPNVVLEAMASGLPVVGGDVGALATALDGTAGLVVPPGDPGALADSLALLVARPDLRETIGRAARASVVRRFDLRRCGEHLVGRLRAAYA
ncbi:MAG TPA: glycosyltransferase, partial [Gaiellaceae bacterium]|nr:glycosyltransferase [Gaiellaceae bacterium]